MKVLLIGMDGAHIGAFKRGWTPYIESLIEKGTNLNLKNDLVSRGWLEIATGQHASVTGAMYDKPKADGTHQWNLKFSINDIPDLGTTVKPIWQAINETGHRVGVMNLPTVFPAPKVNGFFISGGGGGAPVVATPTADLCYPKDVLSTLLENEYIVDQRVPQLIVERKLTTSSSIFKELIRMNNRRTSAFIELAKKTKIDFGFIVYKTTSVITETILTSEFKKFKENSNSEVVNSAEQYYRAFDQELKRLHDEFPQASVVIVSDHGSIARSHTVNPNIFLQKLGYQTAKSSLSLKKVAINKLKEIIPFSLKMALKKNVSIKNVVAETINFDKQKTLAFCRTKNDWTHGIFINDSQRFGGPVAPSDISRLKMEIIEKFNASPDVIEHKIKAYSLDSHPSKPLRVFPDIILDMPSGYLTYDSSANFIESYSPPNNLNSLDGILRGDMVSMKSHEPLSVITRGKKSLLTKIGRKDLTAVYWLILNEFQEFQPN